MSAAAVLLVGATDSRGISGITRGSAIVTEEGLMPRPVVTAAIARRASGAVKAFSVLPAAIVRQQIDTAVKAPAPSAALIGCLARHQTVSSVAVRIKRREIARVVLLATAESGGRALVTQRGLKAMRRELAPLAELVAGDWASLGAMLGRSIRMKSQAAEAAAEITGSGAGWALVCRSDAPGSPGQLYRAGEEAPQAEVEVGPDGLEADVVAMVCRLAQGKRIVEAVCPHLAAEASAESSRQRKSGGW